MSVTYTKFVKSDGQLTKSIYLDDGDIVKDASQCFMSLGEAKTVKTDFPGFYRFLLATNNPNATNNVALGQGVCGRERVQIASRSLLARHPGAIPRTKEHFQYPDGEALWLLDYDPPKNGIALSREELLCVLESVTPGFAQAEKLITSSTSSGIYRIDPGEGDFETVETTNELGEPCVRKVQRPAIDAGGLHLYIRVKSGSDIPRATKGLFKRLWLTGHGRIDVSKAGAMLERTLIDAAVSSPERLDFCARPVLGEGLRQYRRDPEHRPGTTLDTALIADLTEGEEARYLELVEAAKEKARPEAEALGRKFKERRKRELIDRGVPQRQVEETIERAYGERRSLTGGFPLEFREHGKVTVADVLRDPMKFDGCDLLDPWEPGNESRWRARLYVNDGRIVIHSFDSGGVNYHVERTDILLREGDLHRTVETTEAVLMCETVPRVFQRGGELVNITRREDSTTGAIRRAAGVAQIQALNEHSLHMALGCLARFRKPNAKGVPVTKDAPERLLKMLLNRGESGLPVLTGVVQHPTLAPEGSIVEREGYDSATGLFIDLSGCDFPSVLQLPSRNDALIALGVLRGAVSTFPFTADVDVSVWLAAVLTACIRRSLSTAPMFYFNAPVPGSGKTLLARAVGRIVTGREPVTMAYTTDEDEIRKRFVALLREGHPAILLDNVSNTLKSDLLCLLLTQEVFADRVLGVSRNVVVPTNTVLLGSGNNTLIAGDLVRRTLMSNVDPQCERPYERSFDRDFLAYCDEHRGALIVAALTILRAYVVAGKPDVGVSPMGSFEGWSRWVRNALIWLGCADPVVALNANAEEDPELTQLGAMLNAWKSAYGGVAVTAGKAVRAEGVLCDATGRAVLLEAMEAVALGRNGNIDSRRLAEYIRRRKGRIVDGKRFVSAGTYQGATLWRVELAGSMS
jgi:hypothetical protein